MSEAKRFPTLIYIVILGFIVLLAVAPVLSVVVSSAIANAAGCALDEGGSHPCVIGGKDWGEALNAMFVLGWFMLLTLPAGALAFAVWTVTLVLHRANWRRRQSAASVPPPLPN